MGVCLSQCIIIIIVIHPLIPPAPSRSPPHHPPCTGSRPVTTLLWRVMNILRLCDSLCVHSPSCSVLCISSQNARVAIVVINWDVALNWMGCNQRTAKRTVQFQLFVWHRTEPGQKARLHSHVQPDSITFKWWWWSLLITSLGGYQLYVRWLVLLCCCSLAFCRIFTRRRGSFIFKIRFINFYCPTATPGSNIFCKSILLHSCSMDREFLQLLYINRRCSILSGGFTAKEEKWKKGQFGEEYWKDSFHGTRKWKVYHFTSLKQFVEGNDREEEEED